MSPADREPETRNAERPQGYDRRRLRRLHLAALVAVPGCLAAGAFELTRALDGNQLSWVYAVEWPVFAGYGIYMWRRLVREQTQIDDAPSAGSAAGAPHGPGPVDAGPDADPALRAWQEYQSRLHASQPPGGPPSAHDTVRKTRRGRPLDE